MHLHEVLVIIWKSKDFVQIIRRMYKKDCR
jgi:hypothetical protein